MSRSSGPQQSLRAAVGRTRRRVWQALQRVDPVRLLLRPVPPGCRVGFVCVYRARNACAVRLLLAQLPPGSVARLWSLDDVPADLEEITVGNGPGSRFTLLNRLLTHIPASSRADALVFADDDVRMIVGDVGRLVATARWGGLDLYQPAHSACSYANWKFVRRRCFTLLRRTHFVEQGPVVGLSGRAQAALLPFPEDMAMGWGVEARWWSAARRDGLILGVVDAVAVQHLVPTAIDYDRTQEEHQLEAELRHAGLTDMNELQRIVGRTRWPARRPRFG